MSRRNRKAGVAYLLDTIPGAAEDSRLLLLAFWKLCDGIDIPRSVFQEVMARGSYPDSIFRRKREILESRRRGVSRVQSDLASARSADTAR